MEKNNSNTIINSIDDYINNFKLKNIDDSDEEDDIFSIHDKIGKENKLSNEILTSYTLIKSEAKEQINNEIFSHNNSDKSYQEIQKFKNISDNYKNIFNKKVEILSSEAIEKEINDIDIDDQIQDNYEILDLYNVSDSIKQAPKQEEEIIQRDLKTSVIQSYDTYDEIYKNFSIVTNVAIFNKNTLLLRNKKKLSIIPNSISTLNKNSIDDILESEYSPISYSEKLSHKIKTMVNEIKMKIEKDQIKNLCEEEYILIVLLSNYFGNNFKSTYIEPNNNIKRKDILLQLKKLKLLKTSTYPKFKENKFNFEEEKKRVDGSLENVIDKGLENLLIECTSEKSQFNLLFYSIFSKKEDIFNYILKIYEANPHYKEDDLYILFMIKSGNITQLIKEKSEFIFSNFFIILCLLIDNYEYFDRNSITSFFTNLNSVESKLKTLHVKLILSILTNSFSFIDNREYTNLISNYLNFPSYEKLFMADLLNYFNYTNMKEEESFKLPAIGYCSILIKYKYLCLKFQVGKEITNGIKLYDNLKQFGGICKNNQFVDYMKEFLLGVETHSKFDLESVKEAKRVETNKNELFSSDNNHLVKEIASNGVNKENEKLSQSKGGGIGIGSYLISALGFGPNQPKQNKITEKTEEIKKESNSNLTDQSAEPEMYYDSTKKRWVLKGKIYDDENSSTTDTPSSFNSKIDQSNSNDIFWTPTPEKKNPLPIKSSQSVKIMPPKKTSKNDNNTEDAVGAPTKLITKVQPQSQPQPQKLSNPFSLKNEGSQSQPIIKKNNLTNRYTPFKDYTDN